MKILVADKVSPKMIEQFKTLGADVVYEPTVTAEELPKTITDAKILVVRSKKVTAETIFAGESLSLIVRAGAGVNTIDLDAASRSGTYVANCPEKNTDAVAEIAIGHLIATDRGIADATQALRQGLWQKKKFGGAAGLKGRTLGIVGIGAIGMAVARRAKALGMQVLACSRSLTPEKADTLDIGFASSPLELAKAADAVSVHVASLPQTQGMINKDFFDAMKPGSIFINTSRGEVVDHAALEQAIEEKQIKAGLDVFANEPAGGEASFDQTKLAEKVTCTPHIGASTRQSEEAIAEEAVRVVTVFIDSGSPPNVVNVRKGTTAGATVVIRHYNRVGVLARVLDQLRDEGINIEEMQNLIFKHDEAASCTMMVDTQPSAEMLEQLKQDDNIIEITC